MGDGREEFWPSPDDALSPEEKRERAKHDSEPKTERTAKGHEVPVPKRSEFFANLKKVGKTRPSISYRPPKK